jgi:hypothetical protein
MGFPTRIRSSNWPMGGPIGQLEAPVQWTGGIGEPEGPYHRYKKTSVGGTK